jgi:8-oxo-dGTP pyrophosphatase MutT (NUDIX family)
MKTWRRLGTERVAGCRVFDLDRVLYQPADERPPREFFVVEAPDWINVIPVTDTGEVVLIRQFRFGTDSVTLEIPGGMCDAGESPEESARRELLEETGHAAREIVPVGWVHPNPAIQNNRCHTFLAKGVHRVADPHGDPDESFEVVLEPLSRIPELIRSGAITHALVIAAFCKGDWHLF